MWRILYPEYYPKGKYYVYVICIFTKNNISCTWLSTCYVAGILLLPLSVYITSLNTTGIVPLPSVLLVSILILQMKKVKTRETD